MRRYSIVAMLLVFMVSSFSLLNISHAPPALEIKKFYLKQTESFIENAKEFQSLIQTGNNSELHRQFFKLRSAYKQIEVFAEYFYEFYAGKLNGPPIPFFEESEPDVPEFKPYGMQVIEDLIFPGYNPENSRQLKFQTDELLRYAIELPAIHESFELNDENIFDAIMEEAYRITALGITGFDSPKAQNSLPECASALNSLEQYLAFYNESNSEKQKGKYELLRQYINKAILYIKRNTDFNSFNRMLFITDFLNPITKIIGEFKELNGFKDNPAGLYYSAVRKNNTLFNPGAFNPYRFLDDFSSSPEKVELGRMLFFDTRLSSNNNRSCASCHQPVKAFTDGLKTSLSVDGHSPLRRNAPTLWNAALQRNLFHDSRSRNLEEQVMQVLNNALEMHGSAKLVSEKIVSDELYKNIYLKIYADSTHSYAAQNICNAIACYERTLIGLNSKFDKHMNGQPSLTKKEINGFNLFMGKAKCGACHFMPLFSGARPPRYYYMESEVIGVPANSNKLNAKLDSDSGRYLITGSKIHLFSFKTPSLRNIALTAPYMHNGVYKTLEEVVDFYNKGGGKGLKIAPDNETLPFDKLNLSAHEKKDLILFMRCLTDTSSLY